MSHLEWLYANGWISNEDFNTLEEAYPRKYQISENSIFRFAFKK